MDFEIQEDTKATSFQDTLRLAIENASPEKHITFEQASPVLDFFEAKTSF